MRPVGNLRRSGDAGNMCKGGFAESGRAELVRDDGKVDLGVWRHTDKKSLVIPLDVHVYDEATALGLTARKSKDIVTAREITDSFREIFPDDPCLGDFALFGYGVTHL